MNLLYIPGYQLLQGMFLTVVMVLMFLGNKALVNIAVFREALSTPERFFLLESTLFISGVFVSMHCYCATVTN